MRMNDMAKEIILISACLLGQNCRYDGKSKPVSELFKLKEFYDLIPVCPEVLGSLKTPRIPAEIQGDKVITQNNKDVTENYHNGAYWASSVCRMKNIKLAVLKEKSPSCGVHLIHDGSFSGKTIPGQGITTQKLLKQGIKVINEEEAVELYHRLKNGESA